MTEQTRARGTGRIVLPSGEELAGPGLCVFDPADDPRGRAQQVAALRIGIDLGLTVVDTAGRHPADGVETLVAEAVRDRRDDLFLIGRLPVDRLPPPATIRDDVLRACEESLRRLATDRIDLYLVRRCGTVPLEEIVGAVNLLMTEGRIRHWGVAGFDVAELVELTAVPGGTAVEVNQVDYDLTQRDVERDLLPRCRAARLPLLVHVAAARPPSATVGPGDGMAHPALTAVALRHGVSPDQVRLAWMLHQDGVYALAEASTPQQVRRHREALDLALALTEPDLAELDRAFPPPDNRWPRTGSPPDPGRTAQPG